jgi:hypothetical protein
LVVCINDNYSTLSTFQIQKADTFVSTFWGTDQSCGFFYCLPCEALAKLEAKCCATALDNLCII